MKKIITTSVFILACFASLFSTEPTIGENSCCPVVYSSENVELSYDVSKYSEYFSPAYFNDKTNSIHFESHINIKYVQVFNEDGEMEYQLPVMSGKVRMNKNLFSKGEYKISFHMDMDEGQDALVAYVNIN